MGNQGSGDRSQRTEVRGQKAGSKSRSRKRSTKRRMSQSQMRSRRAALFLLPIFLFLLFRILLS
jgi:hypothetical protein